MQKPSKKVKRKNISLPVILVLAAALVGLGILVYQGVRALGGNPIIKSQDDAPRISVQDAYQAVRNGEAVLVDTRSAEQYAAQHAARAFNLPVYNLESLLAALDPDLHYLLYLTG